jgi:lipopolysaccharide transport system ATP-binding protein
MKPIIQIEHLSKQYALGVRDAAYDTLRESIVRTIRAPFERGRRGNGKRNSETIWALKDVGFEVAPGEVIGVIGRNGAGKSTLLKVLSRITEPTSGRARLYGRVASLLEVGTGFHAELTGRENIYLNGAILGMKRSEIDSKFDQIVDFSELEKFLDTPVKRYSSGMYMRLAFAVASHLEPEILVIDEVLAVGDVSFQRKCLGKMGDAAREGRTVLFVSHNMVAVQSLCTRAVWLEKGELHEDGKTSPVISNYLSATLAIPTEQVWEDIMTAPGNDQIRIRRASVRSAGNEASDSMTVSTPITIEFEYRNLVPDAYIHLSVVVKTQEGYTIFNTGSGKEPRWSGKPYPVGSFRSRFYIPADLLNDGTHRVDLYVVRNKSEVIFNFADLLVFDVHDVTESSGVWYGKWIGAVRPRLQWETEFLTEES